MRHKIRQSSLKMSVYPEQYKGKVNVAVTPKASGWTQRSSGATGINGEVRATVLVYGQVLLSARWRRLGVHVRMMA